MTWDEIIMQATKVFIFVFFGVFLIRCFMPVANDIHSIQLGIKKLSTDIPCKTGEYHIK